VRHRPDPIGNGLYDHGMVSLFDMQVFDAEDALELLQTMLAVRDSAPMFGYVLAFESHLRFMEMPVPWNDTDIDPIRLLDCYSTKNEAIRQICKILRQRFAQIAEITGIAVSLPDGTTAGARGVDYLVCSHVNGETLEVQRLTGTQLVDACLRDGPCTVLSPLGDVLERMLAPLQERPDYF
jgi:hypothetical protein